MATHRKNKQENEIWNKAISGDINSIAQLVNIYKDFSFTIAMSVVANNEDAEEVVQDSFMKAFASLGKFKQASKFSTWLYRIVYNTALTKLKRRKSPAISIDQQQENEQDGTTENQGWDLVKDAERKKYVTLALNKLSREDRLVLILHYIEEKNIAEICEILGAGKSAIKMRLLRGRKQLEMELGLLLNHETRNLL
ncbi:RNA polymerase sigma-70 factor, ECF subfamily [Chitinophaga ginsengisegetis]|uniref:RNA polymerase sigma factor n=1 Tax=Chitinophaga ginsengisegetis TaxID=393003 RepID=A0A1T5NNP6_9BACT|nr:sigma-70 family RNA polymerase sigma factor [Chitinophaga ginsengisegetis]SKD02220.1 RNA polymerase sigma-70 factor, ECF subfamily [Chitinophaga ginsengisegetis]